MADCSIMTLRRQSGRLSGVTVAGMAVALVTVILLVYILVWLVYAYHRPDTRAALQLLEVVVGALFHPVYNVFSRNSVKI